MKGIVNFLEKAGLVKMDEPVAGEEEGAPESETGAGADFSLGAVSNQPVLVPGDPEREYDAERRANGIPLLDPVVKDLTGLAEKFSLDFKF